MLGRIVCAAADHDDARGAGKVVENPVHEREVSEVVHAERHLDPVIGCLRTRHHLNARVAYECVHWWKLGSAQALHEAAH